MGHVKFQMEGEGREVEFRFHRHPETITSGQVISMGRANTWPRTEALRLASFLLVQIKASPWRYDSAVLINTQIVWTFTWNDSNDWTVEEFRYDGQTYRLEYRTRWPYFGDE